MWVQCALYISSNLSRFKPIPSASTRTIEVLEHRVFEFANAVFSSVAMVLMFTDWIAEITGWVGPHSQPSASTCTKSLSIESSDLQTMIFRQLQ